ncbi:MAG: ABC transporter [Deltaproteobacteria bacterium]|nr:MAG: ABC transporter [Deltaproteobacteria bacterium]
MDKLLTGKLARSLAGGHTAVKVGGKMLSYYAKRPFLSKTGRHEAKTAASAAGAETLFQGLSLLKGTALKIAQQLSLEMDILPEAACRELAKAYHQVPPINRALVRKVIKEGLGAPPEEIFSHFDLKAFAAASLGQVHRGMDTDQRSLAVKIQYPGIAVTIENDLALVRQILRPMVQKEHLMPVLHELAARLREEVDYLKEADNLRFFSDHLKVDGVRYPVVYRRYTSPTVLTATLMPGKPLDLWLKDNPDQAAKDLVARRLNSIFVEGLYALNVVHADPNPGNFIIADDLSIGLVDFGCIKRLSPSFVEHYRRLSHASSHQSGEEHFQEMVHLGFVPEDLDESTLDAIRDILNTFSHWFGRLFADELFDFNAHDGFISEAKRSIRQFHRLRRHLRVNPDFLFLDRTRYGLLRIFEQMGARVAFRNSYEW